MPHLTDLRFDLERHTLANGLRVILHRDRRLPLVAVNLWYHVGSKNEQPGRTGFAHLFEHLLFQGSQNVGTNEHFRWVQQAGGVANGSTWYDRTNYFETLPSHQLDLGLWLESDRMGFFLPAVSQQKLDTQRDVVINERRQRVENQPYGRAWESLFELMFPDGHPYSWPVIGYTRDIEAANLDMVREFFATYYAPNNAVLTLAGDLPDDALDRVERYFAAIDGGPAVVRPDLERPRIERAQASVLEDDIDLERLYIGYHLPPYGQASWYAADLLTTALSGGKSSPMYSDLVYDRRLAQEVGAFVTPTEASSVLTFIATARSGADLQQLEDEILHHVQRVVDGRLAGEHLERARQSELTAAFNDLQQLEHRANVLSQHATFFDDPSLAWSESERFRQVTGKQVREVAAEYLDADNRSTLRVVSRGAK